MRAYMVTIEEGTLLRAASRMKLLLNGSFFDSRNISLLAFSRVTIELIVPSFILFHNDSLVRAAP